MSTTANVPPVSPERAASPTFCLITLGCEKNEVDSDRMRSRLLEAGYGEVDEVGDASVCIVNTCGFLADATTESIEAVLFAADADAALVMCGCVPSRYGADLERELEEVDAFIGVDEEDRIVDVVEDLVGVARGFDAASTDVALRELFDSDVLRTTGRSVAFVKIAEGCNRRCSFCAIPLIRGPLRSREAHDIIHEARALVAGGAQELVLIAQDTSAWGRDLEGRPTLSSLLWDLSRALEGTGTWIRVLYAQPEGIDDALIDALAHAPGVVPYLDLPLQHCAEHLLESMGRKGNREAFEALIARLREGVPGITLRTTVMCGYPGETEGDFSELCDFLADAAFDYVAVFPFSAEEGTRAADLAGQVDEATKLARTQIVRDVTEDIGFKKTADRVGSTVEAIVDAQTPDDPDGEWVAHAAFQAPASDGVIHVRGPVEGPCSKVRLRLVDAWCYDLEGEVCDG